MSGKLKQGDEFVAGLHFMSYVYACVERVFSSEENKFSESLAPALIRIHGLIKTTRSAVYGAWFCFNGSQRH